MRGCDQTRLGGEVTESLPTEFSEQELVLQAVSGDEEALTTLLRRFGPVVRERVKSRIGRQWRSSIDEDDVMQVTYLEAFLLINQFQPRGPGSFLAWLSHVAENNLRDAVRGLQAAKRPDPRRRVHPRGSSDSYVALVEMLGSTDSTPSRHAARDESTQYLEKALGTLPPDYERVVRLYDLEGHSATEVAELLGRSPGAIYMLRARAHERLKESLGATGSKFFTNPG